MRVVTGVALAAMMVALPASAASPSPQRPAAAPAVTARMDAAPCDPIVARATLAATDPNDAPDDALGLCVARDPQAPELLRAALDGQPHHAGLSRALALSLLAVPDRVWTAEDVARLLPGDKRLVGDGLRARRGRATPVLEHARTFARAGWYRPVANWTPALLTDTDRANVTLLEAPPAPLAQVVAPEALPPPPPMAVEPPGVCGCGSTSTPSGARVALVGAFALLLLRRRRRVR